MFKIGDKVFDKWRKPQASGKVINDARSDKYPIHVEWSDGTSECYTKDGRWGLGCAPSLSKEDYEVPKMVIEEPFKKGEAVLVWNDCNENAKHKRYYIYTGDNGRYCVANLEGLDVGFGISWWDNCERYEPKNI